jgi:hypothetical protein
MRFISAPSRRRRRKRPAPSPRRRPARPLPPSFPPRRHSERSVEPPTLPPNPCCRYMAKMAGGSSAARARASCAPVGMTAGGGETRCAVGWGGAMRGAGAVREPPAQPPPTCTLACTSNILPIFGGKFFSSLKRLDEANERRVHHYCRAFRRPVQGEG